MQIRWPCSLCLTAHLWGLWWPYKRCWCKDPLGCQQWVKKTRTLSFTEMIYVKSFLPGQQNEMPSWAVHQRQHEGKGRSLQLVGLNWVGVGVRINFQASLQCQSNAALLVWSPSPLLLAMGEIMKFPCLQALGSSRIKKSPWSMFLKVFHLSRSEASWGIIVSPQFVVFHKYFIFILIFLPNTQNTLLCQEQLSKHQHFTLKV